MITRFVQGLARLGPAKNCETQTVSVFSSVARGRVILFQYISDSSTMASIKNETSTEIVDFEQCLEEHIPDSLLPDIKRLLYGSNVQ